VICKHAVSLYPQHRRHEVLEWAAQCLVHLDPLGLMNPAGLEQSAIALGPGCAVTAMCPPRRYDREDGAAAPLRPRRCSPHRESRRTAAHALMQPA
jgi:hypothetical protein